MKRKTNIITLTILIVAANCGLIAAQSRRKNAMRKAAPDPAIQPDARSLKDNPAGETICSPYFSQGCINEDTDTSTISEKENENEKN